MKIKRGEKMKKSVLILLAIVAILLMGGAFAFTFMHDIANVAENDDSGTIHKIANKVDQVSSSDGSGGSSDSGSDIISEAINYNGQNDGGSFREVTYKDGGFRQYDTESGELIGSSYEEDQEKLGVVDGNLE